MKTILATIDDTYQKRCGNPDRQKATWQKTIAPMFPPDLAAWPEERPSMLLAREGGDLGCAMLWIVQAALVRPFLALIGQQADLIPEQKTLLESISDIDCGAVAHSESREEPVVVTTDTAGLQLNGVKKYITAGDQADFILMTARAPEDEKISRLLLLPINTITPQEMTPLDLNSLYTTSHGRLTLTNKIIPAHYCLPLSPGLIRKTLKINSLVERSLIMEAVLATMIYLNHRLGRLMAEPPLEKNTLNVLLAQQAEYTTATISQARDGVRVELSMVDLNVLGTAIETICNAADAIDLIQDIDLVDRVHDLSFIRSLWPAQIVI